jgi:hypothetical protein
MICHPRDRGAYAILRPTQSLANKLLFVALPCGSWKPLPFEEINGNGFCDQCSLIPTKENLMETKRLIYSTIFVRLGILLAYAVRGDMEKSQLASEKL